MISTSPAETYIVSSGSSDYNRFGCLVAVNTVPYSRISMFETWYKNLNFRLGGHLAAPAETTWPPPVDFPVIFHRVLLCHRFPHQGS